MLVDLRLVLNVGVEFAQRHDTGDLQRRERAVVVIRLNRRQRAHHLRIATAEPYSPSRHAIALRHRGHFNADVERAWRGQEARRLIAVEDDIRIRQIAHDHKTVFLR